MTILARQPLHLALLLVLGAGVAGLVCAFPDTVSGSFLGLGAGGWLWIAVVVAVLHQAYVAFAWRSELHLGLWTRWFGNAAFARYKAGFTVLFLARPLSVLAVAVANRATLPIPAPVAWVLGGACLLPPVYLGVSIRRYFTLDRAYGADHFDPAYRGRPLVRLGIFRWTPDAMYVFGFLVLWAIALLFRSQGALVAAGFQHAAIWAHAFCTERPDLRRIHGPA